MIHAPGPGHTAAVDGDHAIPPEPAETCIQSEYFIGKVEGVDASLPGGVAAEAANAALLDMEQEIRAVAFSIDQLMSLEP